MENTYKDFFEHFGRTKDESMWCSEYCKELWSDSITHILSIADNVSNNIFLFDLPWDMERTYEPVKFDKVITWDYAPGDDPEFIYQMNRHRYWICLGQAYNITGDEKYAITFVNQLKSWIKENPITEESKITTWRTIEAGLRGENWVKAMGYFEYSDNVTTEIKKLFFGSLIEHANYLLACEVPFSEKSNWGVLESHGLYMIGKALGKYEKASLYSKTAINRLEQQLNIQILDDGVHWEQSSMYHNEVLKCCLEVLRVADIYCDKLPQIIYEKTKAMAYANIKWIKPNFKQVTCGDSDETDLRDIIAMCAYQFKDEKLKFVGYKKLDFESVWDYGKKAVEAYEKLGVQDHKEYFNCLKDSGNWYLRSGFNENDDFFHFRCGPLGGGHGHIDKLHIDLSIGGEDVLIDSGRYTYVDGNDRHKLKSAYAHNCIIIDGKEYTNCTDSWGVAPITLAINQNSCIKGKYAFFEGGHLGYINENIYVNRKIVSIGTNIYVVIDEFYGKGVHKYEQLYHFNPEGKVSVENNKINFVGNKVKVDFHTISNDVEISLTDTSISKHYNKIEESKMISVSKNGEAFNSIITVITGDKKNISKNYKVNKIEVTAPVTKCILKDNEAEAIHIKSEEEEYLIVINHLETGSNYEYIGALGVNGLGSVMVCDMKENNKEMVVLKW